MNAVPFDTLKLARKLEASGMTGPMAAGTAEALAEAMGGSELATKADVAGVKAEIADLRTELKGDINDLRTALKGDIAGAKAEIADLRTELKGDINDLRTELKGDINDLRTELKGDIAGFRTEFKADIAGLGTQLRLEMEVLRRDLVIKCGSMLVVAVGVLIAVSRYLPPHP
jgi:hypothetical protein